ncbi:MAG: TIGR00266 family protein [Thermaerobacter sp.]|nr:TIGR00266 family protein [Thermaerobacter sp.]
MEARIHGTTLPVLEIGLVGAESIVAEAGRLSWMSDSVRMQTTALDHGGIFGAVRRAVGGGGWFWTTFSGPGSVAFAATLPGQILETSVVSGRPVLVHARGFLAGTPEIQISVGFQRRLGAGLFGGDGFVLQKLEGRGTAWVELSGEIVTYDLNPGQRLLVHPGHVGMFESSVDFSITTVRGIRNRIFGDEGLFLAALAGPGRVWCQSMPVAQLAHALEPYLPKPQSQ